MILPTKFIPSHICLLTVGALILEKLNRPQTVTRLWDALKSDVRIGSYERLILGLDLLYIIGAIYLEDGLIKKSNYDSGSKSK